MNIIILGAAGAMAITTIKDLINNAEVRKICLCDSNYEELSKRSKLIADKRIETQKIDLFDINGLAKILQGFDVIINSANYETNLCAMEAAIVAKVPLIDLGGLYHMTKKQLTMDKKAKDANVLIIPGVGSDPGTSNILCKYGADKLEKVDEIHIRYGSNFTGLTFAFAAATITHEAAEEAIVYDSGEYKKIPPLSESEYVYFKEPIGVLKTYSILHSELATVPEYIKGLKKVTYQDTWDNEVLRKVKTLYDLGLLDTKKHDFRNIEIIPIDFVTELLSKKTRSEKPGNGWDSLKVTVKGKIDNKKVDYVFDVLSDGNMKNGITPTAYLTGTPPSIVSAMIAKNKISQKGVLPPEACINGYDYLNELKKRNISIYETKIEYNEFD
jgi:saccharopine dehydrogenase-like NADP-dependent oxidoreductase